ncbi:MAG: type IV-A pilus assembly ATPase PilB [Alicycliphilus sp.]|jgi:type IV pilus assembly protein PilB|uniref:Type IV-A pilus assembly ATPase PilB n=1 Tax=Diaphorobacter limosus TaxID=3036128 RepID=A0ABZ0J1F4_9BURK|nr:type IV-A pilus assembly ATPase PilB [Diaphorobacter sp. Y-1]MBP7325329.1 type IV-A pilus assembly ATPase PilB [Alicycliphilus sp.]MCA0439037.1 type IV-A pilus assembly ATPase PilB [Pseudomonadota bacterium]MBP7329168.1 type IV-A pilus assembly ATPase PilB [Alicycliphilus sp.]MBP8778473.1 type IV-A pilus assembly ATPase PilB [Alicycliphilus sp.]WOO32055.1 type IV-A pilus assembly ATPase PilB [Diaphorobacter sp. Y-1]
MATVDSPQKAAQPVALPGLARALMSVDKLNQKTAEEIYKKSVSGRSSFIAELIGANVITSTDLAHTLSSIFGAPLLDVQALDRERLPHDLLDLKLCQAYRVVVLSKRNNRLIVATADPTNQEAAEKIKFTTQMGVDWIIAEYDKLIQLVDAAAKSSNEALDSIVSSGDFEFGDISVEEATEDNNEAAPNEVEDAPVVRFLHKMLLDAFNMRASDLHFEPYEHSYRVRFRIDGELREIASPPIAIKEKLASRIKVISRLDISEKRVPQDGRMKLKVGPDRVIDFRVSTLPTLFGEKIVIRILDPSSAKLGIDALGYEPEEKERLLQAINRPYGMILVTGPTGSGKTVSLYTCLNLLNKPGVNIATAEDPSEINLPGVNQVNVNEKAGLTFAVALKSFLRQDPDIIMVGEIRDLETADISIKAAQTGHLVLSTLHTNDAPTTLTRMRNMGIAPFNIASSVILITAQRLARRLCPQCKEPADIPHETLVEAGYRDEEIDGSWVTYRPVGCSACNNGYKGRVGIYQVMPISEEIQRIILRDGSALDIAEQARREGVRSLREAGLHKARIGLTSLEEVLAVTNE